LEKSNIARFFSTGGRRLSEKPPEFLHKFVLIILLAGTGKPGNLPVGTDRLPIIDLTFFPASASLRTQMEEKHEHQLYLTGRRP
jgi:hypothetical protein